MKKLISVAVVGILSTPFTFPCCGAGPAGTEVLFGGQTNLIVWDSETQTEHFVRNASFKAEARDFGFIAPTPTKPQLAEANPAVFYTLDLLKPQPIDLMPTASKSEDAPGAILSVEVLQVTDVAGYRATTLKANDPTALATWMRQNGYATSAAIEEWTKKYIEKGWLLTAFKVLSHGTLGSTGTVRMSFKTDRPFNPYYVPTENHAAPGSPGLKLYFIAVGGYVGRIGGTNPWLNPSWEADIPNVSVSKLATDLRLPESAIPKHAHLSVYEDHLFPREGADDLFFDPQPPAWLLVGGAFLALGGIFWFVRRSYAKVPSPA